jgi:hypothetical protein
VDLQILQACAGKGFDAVVIVFVHEFYFSEEQQFPVGEQFHDLVDYY